MIEWRPVTPEHLPPSGSIGWILAKDIHLHVILEAVFMESVEDQAGAPGFGTNSGVLMLDQVEAWCPKEAINLPEAKSP